MCKSPIPRKATFYALLVSVSTFKCGKDDALEYVRNTTGRCTFSAARSIDGAKSCEESSAVELPPPDFRQPDPAFADTLQIQRIGTDRALGSCHSCSSLFW